MSNLETSLKNITKVHGEGSIFRIGDKRPLKVEAVSTGLVSLDAALGVGGYPRGRVIEAYGNESSGKSTLAMMGIAEVQKLGGVAGYIDAEHAFDPKYARLLGVDVDNLLVSQPDNGEQGLEIAESLIRSGEVGIVVIDSVAALVPKAELEGDMGDPSMGLMARLMSQALRKLTGATSKTGSILFFINQLREKIGTFYGNPEVTTGGKALKFYSSVRLELKRTQAIKEGDKTIGALTRIRVTKNKTAAPFQECEIDLLYGHGFSRENDLLDFSINRGIVEKSGAWLSFGGERWQGKENARIYLKENPKMFVQLMDKVKTQ